MSVSFTLCIHNTPKCIFTVSQPVSCSVTQTIEIFQIDVYSKKNNNKEDTDQPPE